MKLLNIFHALGLLIAPASALETTPLTETYSVISPNAITSYNNLFNLPGIIKEYKEITMPMGQINTYQLTFRNINNNQELRSRLTLTIYSFNQPSNWTTTVDLGLTTTILDQSTLTGNETIWWDIYTVNKKPQSIANENITGDGYNVNQVKQQIETFANDVKARNPYYDLDTYSFIKDVARYSPNTRTQSYEMEMEESQTYQRTETESSSDLIYTITYQAILIRWMASQNYPKFDTYLSNNSSMTITYAININTEVIDLPGVMWQILGMPFTFISQAFNLTLFAGTGYAFNVADVIFFILGGLLIVFVIRILVAK